MTNTAKQAKADKLRELIAKWRSEQNNYADNPQIASAFNAGLRVAAIELESVLAKSQEEDRKLTALETQMSGRTVYERLFHEAVNFIRQRYPEWYGTADGQQTTLTGVANLIAAFVYDRDAAGAASVAQAELSAWMIAHSFATGHGDTVEDLLKELEWQIAELRSKAAK